MDITNDERRITVEFNLVEIFGLCGGNSVLGHYPDARTLEVRVSPNPLPGNQPHQLTIDGTVDKLSIHRDTFPGMLENMIRYARANDTGALSSHRGKLYFFRIAATNEAELAQIEGWQRAYSADLQQKD